MNRIVAINHEIGHAAFNINGVEVIVNTKTKNASTGVPRVAGDWMTVASDMDYPSVWKELAEAAVTQLEITEKKTPVTERKFRVPKAVREEAAQAMAWVSGFERGNSALGMRMARTLTEENFVPLSTLQRVAKYLSNRENLTENAGWSNGTEGYPSAERIRYGLWGGEAAAAWIDKVSKSYPITENAGGYGAPVEDYDGKKKKKKPVTASAFVYEDGNDYFGVGKSPDSTHCKQLLVRQPDGSWRERVQADWVDTDEPGEDVVLIMLDPDSAKTLADFVDSQEDGSEEYLELSMLNPTEAALWHAAESEIDWTMVERVFDIYDSQERSANAGKQVRDGGGRFGEQGGGEEQAPVEQAPVQPKARLVEPQPLVTDINARIQQYLSEVEANRAPEEPAAPAAGEGEPAEFNSDYVPPGAPAGRQNAAPTPAPSHQQAPAPAEPAAPEAAPTSANVETTDVRPLYLAIVDAVDTDAVLDVVALVPPPPDGGQLSAWKRDQGTWMPADDILSQLQGSAPPPVVELTDDALLQDVLDQVDATTAGENPTPEQSPDAEHMKEPAPAPEGGPIFSHYSEDQRMVYARKGYALPDGSFSVVTETDLKMGLEAFEFAKNKDACKKHLKKRAYALGRVDLLPEEWTLEPVIADASLWGPNGELIDLNVFAGGADRNRGGAEHLRRYWTYGEGGTLKVRWNTPGDFTRCDQHLSKYMGVRAKGYCALRHKEMTGRWPAERDENGELSMLFRGMNTEEQIISLTACAAGDAALYGEGDVLDLEKGDTVADVKPQGKSFTIPLLIPEEMESGDGRVFSEEALSSRWLPIPLLWQPKTGSGHDGSYIVGRIDTLERVENGLGNAKGVFDTGPWGREAQRLVDEKFLRGVSADLDQFEAQVEAEELADDADDEGEKGPEKIKNEKLRATKGRVMAATLVAKPAFQECTIEIDSDLLVEEPSMTDGVYEDVAPVEEHADGALAALAASAAPVNPPEAWFSNPELDAPTPITVTDDGQIYGHIATWETSHLNQSGQRPPRSRSNYAYFRTGLVRCAEGNDVAVGQLTLAGGHATLDKSAAAAVKHYDDTASAVADVSAGEDQFGIWVAGGLRPGVTPEQVRVLRASAPSGDWRPIKNVLELVAVCQVNVPGFPIARARVASGVVTALVAAGAADLYSLREAPMTDVNARLAQLEQAEQARQAAQLAAQKAELVARLAPRREELAARLAAAADAQRARLADQLAARKASREALVASAEAVKARMAEFMLEVKPDFEEHLHPRDGEGRFREVLLKLSELMKTPGGGAGAEGAKSKVEEAEKLDEAGDKAGADDAARQAEQQLDEAAKNADGDGASRLQAAISALRAALAGGGDALNPDTPDEPGQDRSGSSYDDLPEEIRDLLDLIVDEIGENVDPRTMLERLANQVRHWVEGKGFQSPEELARLIQKQLERPVQPDIIQ